MKVLQINTSARQSASHSSRLAAEVVESLRNANGANADFALTLRDLGQAPHAALDEAALGALFTPADQRSVAQAALVAANDALIAELQAHDVIVMAAPMINFGVPSQLKNWIDAVARAGVTFKYTATGPEGLVTGKKVYVVSTRGGFHRGQPTDQGVTDYLRTFLGFLGITDVDFIYAEGLGMGPDAEAKGLADARAQIAGLFAVTGETAAV